MPKIIQRNKEKNKLPKDIIEKGYGERKKLVICLEAGQGTWRKEMRK